jgi:alkanesulfonate monooxygenase SsuD/methylene tetrahydromethanopterin reductase-like flavin-dependent oxidoreductase (luciferase family)
MLIAAGVFDPPHQEARDSDVVLPPLRRFGPPHRIEGALMPAPLTVLDLVPITSHSNASEALRRSVDLARQAEAWGYRRYWVAEHHLNPGVGGTSPPLVIGLLAAATTTIRVGSGGVQMGHRTPLAVVEEFGLLDAVYPGRLDLGVGRSGGRKAPTGRNAGTGSAPGGPNEVNTGRRHTATEIVRGVRVPPPFPVSRLLGAPRFKLSAELLQQPGAETPAYADQVRQLLALLRTGYRSPDDVEIHIVPGEGADVELWILGSSAGDSATIAGQLGLPFAASYHVSPGTALDAVDAYRDAFRPSSDRREPYVCVSADVVVAKDDATARRLASGYGLWVRSIRTGEGAMPFPSPEEASAHVWTEEDRALVADRTETQFVGSPDTVVGQLGALRAATGADELAITTITHEHADRVRSYQLLAEAWRRS